MSSSTAIIIGGGVIGLSTAYHLAKRKHGKVIVLEKGLLGDGSSSRAAAIISNRKVGWLLAVGTKRLSGSKVLMKTACDLNAIAIP